MLRRVDYGYMAPQTLDYTTATGDKNMQGVSSASGADSSLSDAVLILRKRKWLLLAATLLGLIVGFYRLYTQPKLFEAFARVQVRSGSSSEYRINTATPTFIEDPNARIMTEISILQSDSLLLTVARDLNLANDPRFYGGKGPARQLSLDEPSVRNNILGALHAGFNVSLVPKTEIILIGYSSLNAQLSAEVVNKLLEAYVQRSYEVRYASSQQVSRWLSGQLEDLRQTVQKSEDDVMSLQKKLGVLGLDTKANTTNEALDDLAKAAGLARVNRIVAESRYRTLSTSDPTAIEGTVESAPGTAPAEFYSLRSQIAVDKATAAQLLTTYGPNHPLVKAQTNQIAELERQLEAEQKRLLAQSRANYLAAKLTEDQTTGALNAQKGDAYKLSSDMVDFSVKSRELASNRALYDGLSNRLRTAGIEAGLYAAEVDVIDRASVPPGPVQRNYSTVLVATAIFGLIVGIALAFLLESLDTGLRGIAEIESAIGLPSLAVIPRETRSKADRNASSSVAQSNVDVLARPNSHFSEAFRSLRTSLLLSSGARPPKVLLITSSSPDEGKTSAACNLACVLARREAKVLLIDGDLRRPAIHQRFGLKDKLGLSTLLSGASTLEGSVQRVPEAPDLDILVGGPIPPFPTEMLGSSAMASLLERCSATYTHIVIDSPPVLSVTDAVVLARQADAVVLVVRHGKSGKGVVRRARDLLLRAGAPITGLVLNAVDMKSPEYFGHNGYAGYSNSTVDPATWDSQMRAQAKNNLEGRDGQ